MKRRCPRCGAIVPDNSLTCPQCYTEVARDLVGSEPLHSSEEFREQIEQRQKNMRIALILAIIPAIFGFLGLGMIYQDYRDERGWKFLGVGLVLFLFPVLSIIVLGIAGIFAAVLLLIPLFFSLLAYAGMALLSIAETYFGSFRFLFTR